MTVIGKMVSILSLIIICNFLTAQEERVKYILKDDITFSSKVLGFSNISEIQYGKNGLKSLSSDRREEELYGEYLTTYRDSINGVTAMFFDDGFSLYYFTNSSDVIVSIRDICDVYIGMHCSEIEKCFKGNYAISKSFNSKSMSIPIDSPDSSYIFSVYWDDETLVINRISLDLLG